MFTSNVEQAQGYIFHPHNGMDRRWAVEAPLHRIGNGLREVGEMCPQDVPGKVKRQEEDTVPHANFLRVDEGIFLQSLLLQPPPLEAAPSHAAPLSKDLS